MQEGTNSLRRLRRDWWKTKLCTACVSPLGRFLSRGLTCPQCGLRVCKNCRTESQSGIWVCVLCSSGGMPSDDVAKTTKSLGRDSRSIRRSWTISNPQRAQTNSPILKSYTVLYPEDGEATMTDGGNGEPSGNQYSISTGHISTLDDRRSSSAGKNKRFGGSDQGLNSFKNNKTANIIGAHHSRNIDAIIRQKKIELKGENCHSHDNQKPVGSAAQLRQFHSLPRMSSNSTGGLSTLASSTPAAAKVLGLVNKTGKRSFNEGNFDKENIKRHRSFQTTLHPYNPSHVNNNPPSPAASVNFIEETFWDYYDYEYENSSSDPGSTPRNLRRTVTAAAISENSSASARRGYPRENSNRSSCERSLGETMDYDCSLKMNQFSSISDTELNETGKCEDGEKTKEKGKLGYPTVSPSSSSSYRRYSNGETHAHPRSSYHYATVSSSINPYLPASEYVYRRRHHDHDMLPNEAPPKPERKFRNSKRSVSLNAYDGRKLFSPLRTYCVLMKENIEPGKQTESETRQSNDPTVSSLPKPPFPNPNTFSDTSRKNTSTSSDFVNNSSPISLSFTTTNSSMKFNSLPRERYIKIEREDGDGSTNTSNKFSSLKYPKKSEMTLLGKSAASTETGSRERNVTRVPINNDDNSESRFPIRNNFTFNPPKSKIERSQSYREISSSRPYHSVSASAVSQPNQQQQRHQHHQFPTNASDKASTTVVDLNFVPHAGTATLPNFRTGKIKPSTSSSYMAWDSGKKLENGSGPRNFFNSQFDDGSDVVIENFIKIHSGSGDINSTSTLHNTLPKRKYPPTTTHISSVPPPPHPHYHHQHRRASDDNKPSNTSTNLSSDAFQQVDPSQANYLRQCSTFPRGARGRKEESATGAEISLQKQTELLPNTHRKNNLGALSNQRNNSLPSNETPPKLYHPIDKQDIFLYHPSKTGSLTLPQSSNNLFDVPKKPQQQQTERIVPIKMGTMLTGPGSSATLPHPYIRRNKQLSINSFSSSDRNNDNNGQQQHHSNEAATSVSSQSKASTGDSGPSISEVEMEIERDIFYQKTRSLDRVRPSSKSKLKSVLSLVRGNHHHHASSKDNNENPVGAGVGSTIEIDYSDSQPYNNKGRFSSQQENIFSIDQLDRNYANARNNGSGKSAHMPTNSSTNDLMLQPQQIHHSNKSTAASTPPAPIPSPRLKRKTKLQQNEPNSSSSPMTPPSSSSFSQQNAHNPTLYSPKINRDEMSSSTSSKLIGPGTNFYGSKKQASFSSSNTPSSAHLLNEPDHYNQPHQQEHYHQSQQKRNETPMHPHLSKTNSSSAANPISPSVGNISNASSGPSTKFSFAKDTSIKPSDHLSSSPSPTTLFNNSNNRSNSVDGLMNSEKPMSASPNNISQPSATTTLPGPVAVPLNYSNSDSPGVNFMISNSPSSSPVSVSEMDLQSQQQHSHLSSSSCRGKTPVSGAMHTGIDSSSPQHIKSALANPTSSSAEAFNSKLANSSGNLQKAVRFEPHVIESEQRKLLQQQMNQQQLAVSGTEGSVPAHNNNPNGVGINNSMSGEASVSNNGSSNGKSGQHHHYMQRHVYGIKGRHHHFPHSSSNNSSSSSYLPVLYHSYHNQQHKYIRKGTNGNNVIAGVSGMKGGSGKKSKKYKGFVARAIAKVKSKAANIKKDSSSSTSSASPTVYIPVPQRGNKGTSSSMQQQQYNSSSASSLNNPNGNSNSPSSSSPSVITYISPQPQTQHSQPPVQHSLEEGSSTLQPQSSGSGNNVPTITVSLTSTSEEVGGSSSVNGQQTTKKYILPGGGKLKKSLHGKGYKGILLSGPKPFSGGLSPSTVPRRMDSYLDNSSSRVIGDESQNQMPESFTLHMDRITPSSTSSSSSSFTSNIQESYDLFHNQNLPDNVHELVGNATISPDKNVDNKGEIEENFDSLNEDEDSNGNEGDDDRHFAFKSFDESDDFEDEEPDFVFYRTNPTDSSIPPPSINISSGSVRPQQQHLQYNSSNINNIDVDRNKIITGAAASSTHVESYAPFPTSTNHNNNETTTKGNNTISNAAAVTITPDSTKDNCNSSMKNRGKSTAEPKMVVGIPTYRSPNSRKIVSNSHHKPQQQQHSNHYGKSQGSIPSPNANPINFSPKSINENVKQLQSSSTTSSSSSLYKEPHPSLYQEETFSSPSPNENIITRDNKAMGSSSSPQNFGMSPHNHKDSFTAVEPFHQQYQCSNNNRHENSCSKEDAKNGSGSRTTLQERMKGLSQQYQQQLPSPSLPLAHPQAGKKPHKNKPMRTNEEKSQQQQQTFNRNDSKGSSGSRRYVNELNSDDDVARNHHPEKNAEYDYTSAEDTFMQKTKNDNVLMNKNTITTSHVAKYNDNIDNDESCSRGSDGKEKVIRTIPPLSSNPVDVAAKKVSKDDEGIAGSASSTEIPLPSSSSNNINLKNTKDRLSDLTTPSNVDVNDEDNVTITRLSRGQEQLGVVPKNLDETPKGTQFKGDKALLLRRDGSSGNSGGVTTSTVNANGKSYVNKDGIPSYNVSTLGSNSAQSTDNSKLLNPSVKNNLQEVQQEENESSSAESNSILQARISSNSSSSNNNDNVNRKNQSSVTNNGNENRKDVERLRRLELVKKQQNLFKSQSQAANFNFPNSYKASNSGAGSASNQIIKPEQEELYNETIEGRETPSTTSNRSTEDDETFSNNNSFLEQPNSLETHCANDQSFLSESESSSICSGKSPSPSPRFRCKKQGNKQFGGNRVQNHHHLLNSQQQQMKRGSPSYNKGNKAHQQRQQRLSPENPSDSSAAGMSILPPHQQYSTNPTEATSLSVNDNNGISNNNFGKFRSRVLLNSDDLEDDEELSRAVASALSSSSSNKVVGSGIQQISRNNSNASNASSSAGKKNVTTVEISGDVGIVSNNLLGGNCSDNFSRNQSNGAIGRKHLSNEHLQSSGLSLIQKPTHLLDLHSDNESFIDDGIGIINERPIEPEIKEKLVDKVVRRSLSEDVGSSVSANESSGNDTEKTSGDDTNSSDWQSESTNTVIFRGGAGVVDSDHHPFFETPTGYLDPEIQINNITVGEESFLPVGADVEEGGSGIITSKVNVGHKATKVNKVSSDLIIGIKNKPTTDKISSSSSSSSMLTGDNETGVKIGTKRKFDKNNDVSSSSSSSTADSSEELGKSNETLTDIPVSDGNHHQQQPQIPEETEEQDNLEVEMVIHPDKKIINGGNRVFVAGNTQKSSPHHRRESPEGQEQEVPNRSSYSEDKTKAPSKQELQIIDHQSIPPTVVAPNTNEVKMEENDEDPSKSGAHAHDSSAGGNEGGAGSRTKNKKSFSNRGTINKEKILQTMLSHIPSRSSPDGADKSDATPEPDVESPTPPGVIDTFDVTSDEDSWVEEILFEDEDDTSFEQAVKKLPPPLDLTLHTIVEESCEESEAENSGNFYQPSTSGLGGSQKNPSLSQSESNANELEKYFNFGIYPEASASGKNSIPNEESEFSDTFSESSFSLQEDDFDNGTQEGLLDPAELASTRLEKYFYNLGGPQSMMNHPMGNTIISQHADSDSVGSESDSDNSVLEKRKKVLKHHRRSADFDEEFGDKISDEEENFGFGQDGFDTIKKTARKTKKSGSDGSISANDSGNNQTSTSLNQNLSSMISDHGGDTTAELSSSIFEAKSPKSLKKSDYEPSSLSKVSPHPPGNEKPAIKVNRSNSFTWSSDEEVNIMMSKLRQLIKNLVKSKAESANGNNSANAQSSTSFKSAANNASTSETLLPPGGSGANIKDKQLVYLENELIRLMKTDNLKNIVEYLSSEESDVDDVYKFIKVVNSSGSTPVDLDDLGDLGDLDIDDPNLLENLQSTMQLQQDGTVGPSNASPKSSPALLAKVMNHIGNRLNVWMKDEGNLEEDNNDDTVTLKCAPSVSSDLNEDRFSWKGSFESALAAKRQSVGSTDSISSSDYGQDKSMLRSSSLHHLTTSQPIEENKEEEQPTSSLPRMTNLCNSLPRLNNQPNNQAISRAHSLVMTAGKNEQLQQGAEPYPVSISGPVKSARYRPPGFQPSMKTKRIDTEEKASPAIFSQSTPVLTQDPAILKNRSDSMGSIFNDVKPLIKVKGQVEFGLQYNYKLACLEVKVVECRDLAAADSKRNRSDPYVKAYLLPDKSKAGKRKTKTKKNTFNPVFDEILKFPLTLSDLQNRTLWLSVWHSDMFGKNEFLGEVLVNLKDRVFDDPNPGWWDLEEMSGQMEDMPKGDVVIALKWQPKTDSTGNLSVLVKEAKNLVPVKNGSPSTFVKCALLSDKTRKQKTSICRRNFNPIWNQTLFFEDVDDDGIEITIWNHDLLASHDLIGTIRVEYDNPLWESMISRPSFWVEGGMKLS